VSGPGFTALYYPDRLRTVNPQGDVGIVTLWSPVRAVERKLGAALPEFLDPERSRVAVISNLYGDGMYAMFCNLLFNPQIRHLIAIGEDLDLPTCAEVEAFLGAGLEDWEMLGTTMKRIRGTQRIFPDLVGFDADRLRRTLTFRYLGKLSNSSAAADVADYLSQLPGPTPASQVSRLRVDLPVFDAGRYAYRPSQPSGHEVIRARPLDCWKELVVRVVRFGRPAILPDGPRVELFNAKAVITDPAHEPREVLAGYGFHLDRLLAYQAEIVRPDLPEGVSYTYGNRLRGYFDLGSAGSDALQLVVDALRANPNTRRAHIALWDTAADLPCATPDAVRATPCLTTLFFRCIEKRLTLTATYRAHNLLTAWLENVYGLMAIQQHVATATGLPVGPIIVISHSLGIDPRNSRYELAQTIAENWKRDDDVDQAGRKHSLRADPNGYFVVTIDETEECIVAEHRFAGLLIKRYKSDRAERIEREVSGDMAVSLVSHALWLGRELTRKEQILRARRKPRSR
jgi:Thymidylate synthase